jgi:hypothetical protein
MLGFILSICSAKLRLPRSRCFSSLPPVDQPFCHRRKLWDLRHSGIAPYAAQPLRIDIRQGWARLRTYSRSITWSFLLLAAPVAFVILVLIDAAMSKTEHKQGLVEAKHFSPEFTVPRFKSRQIQRERPSPCPRSKHIPKATRLK